VGAVVVKDKKVIGQGYNGVASGKLHCVDGGCPRGLHYPITIGVNVWCKCGKKWRCPEAAEPGQDYNQFPCYALHAEMNAILDAGLRECGGATIYVTDKPCQQCTNLIEHAKIGRVVVEPRS
jgi:dCMP deaminase